MHKKPQMLVCYLCGQQFGSASLSIHQPQCYQKQLVWWKQADPATRGPKPKDPAVHGHKNQDAMSQGDIQKFNDQQFSDFQENLSPCPNCGRKFLADRLVVHLRSCNPSNSGGGSKPVAGKERPSPGATSPASGSDRARSPSTGRPSRSPGMKPQLLVCYLCGAQFGTRSLAIHMPQCYQKRIIEWKDAEPGKRGPKPKDPSLIPPDEIPENLDDQEKVDRWNSRQFQRFNEEMAKCPNCGRTFMPDRLQVHLRSCNPSNSGGGSKPAPGYSPGASGGGNASSRSSSSSRPAGVKPQMLVCYLCGQQFGSASLPIHQPQCYQKQLAWWKQADKATRGPKPKDPATHGPRPEDIQHMSKDEFNDEQFKDFNSNLSPCPNCGRTFKSDRLAVHLRSCNPDASGGGSKPVNRTTKSPASHANSSPSASRAPSSQDMRPKSQMSGDGVESVESDGAGRTSARNPLVNRLPSNASMEGRACTNCSAVEFDAAARFCQECGAPLPQQAPSSTPPPAPTLACTACGECWESGRFCQSCGSPLVEVTQQPAPDAASVFFCHECGAAAQPGSRFCEECGAPLKQEAVPSPDPTLSKRSPLVNRIPNPTGSEHDNDEYNTDTVPQEEQHRWKTASQAPKELPMVEAESTVGRTVAGRDADDEDEPFFPPGDGANEPSGNGGGQLGDSFVDEDGNEIHRIPCQNCGRKFVPERLAKHQKACTKMKTRKTFNSRSIRVSGTEMEGYQKTKEVPRSQNNWRVKSQAFREAMAASKEIERIKAAGGDMSKLPPPKYTAEELDDRVPCPHCGRKFAADTAERHIPKCATTINRPKAPPKRPGQPDRRSPAPSPRGGSASSGRAKSPVPPPRKGR